MSFEYQAYMLRLWQREENGEKRWLASLEAPGSGERHNFSSMAELFAYLQAQTGETHTHITHRVKDREDGKTNIEINIRFRPG